MQTQLPHRNSEAEDAIYQFTGRLLAELQTRRRSMHIAFPVPRRKACFTRRAKIAALRESELNDWPSADGDECADAMHQPVP